MAETSLDDFFAKKDKSKKTKKKYSTPIDLAKKLEESGKCIEKKKKDKEKGSNSNLNVISGLKLLEQDDDEWKDFEDEKEKDYTGLRIQSLNIKDKEEEMRELKLQENGQDNKKEDGSGPWKLKSSSPVPDEKLAKSEAEKKEEKEGKVVAQSVSIKRYIPPPLRVKISNDEDFPSLGECV